MLQTPLTIQRLYDDNRKSAIRAGSPAFRRRTPDLGDVQSAADQVYLNLIHPPHPGLWPSGNHYFSA
jgi:HPr kinase/phosphorylase